MLSNARLLPGRRVAAVSAVAATRPFAIGIGVSVSVVCMAADIFTDFYPREERGVEADVPLNQYTCRRRLEDDRKLCGCHRSR